MSMDTCIICRRWPNDEDHEGYRRYVMDPEHRYALAPMTFEEWVGLDEVHQGHRDEAKMLEVLIRTPDTLKEGERVWLVPVERPVPPGPDPFPYEDDMPPTYLTRLVKKTIPSHTWMSLTVEGFGHSVREDRYISPHLPYDLVFDSVVLRVVTLFANAVVEKQRSKR